MKKLLCEGRGDATQTTADRSERKAGRAKLGMKNSKKGMELVQVGILIGIAVFLGLIFKTQIGDFINNIFNTLMGAGF
jgi:hypothetical protein